MKEKHNSAMKKSYFFFTNKECSQLFSVEEPCRRETLVPQHNYPVQVFRALKAINICDEDFIPQLANQDDNRKKVRSRPCRNCGLSVFLDQGEISTFLEQPNISRYFHGKAVATISERNHGPIENLPNPVHATWHPYCGVEIVNLFTVAD